MRGISCKTTRYAKRAKKLTITTTTTRNVLYQPFSSSSSSSSSIDSASPSTQPIDYPTLASSKCTHRRTIAAKNTLVNAFVAVSPPTYKSHAKKKAEEPLRGLTIGIKDNIATSDLPTTCSSGILANYTSPFDATVVSLLRTAGADIIGKTNCDEFGMGSMNTHSIHGAVVNPYNLQDQDGETTVQGEKRSAGGSSGGSAAAVAAGMCDVALGTDTGGSIRLPASYCGVVGYKPSYGLFSRFGAVSYADSLDCVGILGRDVDSIQKVGAILNTYDPRDPTAALPEIRTLAHTHTQSRIEDIKSGKRKLRIGVPVEYFPREVSPRLSSQLRGLLKRLTSTKATTTGAGAEKGKGKGMEVEIVPVSLPSTPYALSAYYVLASAEASSNLARYDGVRYGVRVPPPPLGLDEMVKGRTAADVYAYSRTKGFGGEVKKRVLLGCYALSAGAFDNYFLQAQRVRQLVKDDFGRVFGMKDLYHGFEYPSCSPPPTVPPTSPEAPSPDIDILMHLSSIRTAPPLTGSKESDDLDSYVQDVLTVPASLAGLPAMSVPMRIGGGIEGREGNEREGGEEGGEEDAWPVGVSIVGQWGSDEIVFEAGRVVEGVMRGV